MKTWVLIFTGGGLGSVVRFGLGRFVSGLHQLNFPFGTLVVNLVACFVLGLIIGLADHKQLLSADARVFCGRRFLRRLQYFFDVHPRNAGVVSTAGGNNWSGLYCCQRGVVFGCYDGRIGGWEVDLGTKEKGALALFNSSFI